MEDGILSHRGAVATHSTLGSKGHRGDLGSAQSLTRMHERSSYINEVLRRV